MTSSAFLFPWNFLFCGGGGQKWGSGKGGSGGRRGLGRDSLINSSYARSAEMQKPGQWGCAEQLRL